MPPEGTPESSSVPPNSNSRALDPFTVARSILGPSRKSAAPVVAGYQIEGFIAEGGLGQVWRARRIEDGEWVALKIPHRSDPQFVDRLVAEAEALRELQDPNIVRFNALAVTSDDLPVLVMELVEGATLASLLPEGGFELDQAVQIFFSVLDAVGKAHAHGLIHRDLKPSNVLISNSGAVKVSDFGLARALKERLIGFTLSRSGTVAGTVEYLAPECYRSGHSPSPSVDIFALGVLLHELLAGAPPRGAWVPVSQRKRVDVRLDELVADAMNPEPSLRPKTPAEIRRRLEEILSSRPRFAGSPSVNKAVCLADAIWTLGGLYLGIAGFCGTLAMTRTPVPAFFDLTYGLKGLLVGGFLAVWTMALGLGVLWSWQLWRLWRFRGVPLRESLPSPFGVRLGTSKTAAVLVGLTQVFCTWMPVVYALVILGLSFHWRAPDTPMWQEGLVVTPWMTDEPVSPWRWHPAKMFDGGAYWLKQAKGGYIPGTLNVTDKTSFFIFIQPAAMVTAAVIIGIGMGITVIRWTASWWKGRRAAWMATMLPATVGCVTLGLTVARDMDMKKAVAGRTKEEIEKLESRAVIEYFQERFDTIFRTFIAHDPEAVKKAPRPRTAFSRFFLWEIPEWQGPLLSRPHPFNWISVDRKVAAAQNRVLQGISPGGGEMRTDSKKRKILRYDWRYFQFTDPPRGPATAESVRIHLAGYHRAGHPVFADSGVQFFQRLYTAEQVVLTEPEATQLLNEFLAALAESASPKLEEWVIKFLLTDRGRVPSRAVLAAWRAERAKWDSFNLDLIEPLPAPQRLPGARWRLQPNVLQQGTLRGKMAPEAETTLRLTIDIAHVDGRFRVVGNWLGNVSSDGDQPITEN